MNREKVLIVLVPIIFGIGATIGSFVGEINPVLTTRVAYIGIIVSLILIAIVPLGKSRTLKIAMAGLVMTFTTGITASALFLITASVSQKLEAALGITMVVIGMLIARAINYLRKMGEKKQSNTPLIFLLNR